MGNLWHSFNKHGDTHQFLGPTSSHLYHSTKGISYSQALRLNRIYSDHELFDRRWKDLEKWIRKKGYNEKMIRKQILRVWKHSRNDLLGRENMQKPEQKPVFNNHYSAVQNGRTTCIVNA